MRGGGRGIEGIRVVWRERGKGERKKESRRGRYGESVRGGEGERVRERARESVRES